jgi:hypothetical protein
MIAPIGPPQISPISPILKWAADCADSNLCSFDLSVKSVALS